MLNTNVHISQLSHSHLELEDVQVMLKYYEKLEEYGDKYRFYKRVHERTLSKLRTYTTIAIPGTGMITPDGPLSALYYELMEWKRLNEKRLLLEQMMHVASKLACDYHEGGELFFKKLEQDLGAYLDEYDKFLEHHYWAIAPDPFYDYAWNLKTEIKVLKVRLSVLLRKIYRKVYFDIRGHIRSLVRFLHITTDDEDDVTNVIVSNPSISFCNYLIPHHGKRRDYYSYQFG